MDKNTLTGFVLMAAVLFGFMWLSKPAEPELSDNAVTTERPGAQQTTAHAADTPTLITDEAALRNAVVRFGTETPDGGRRLRVSGLDITCDSLGKLSGNFYAGRELPFEAVYGDNASATLEEKAAVHTRVSELLANYNKFGGFGAYMGGGDGAPVVLKNDNVSVELNSKGAMVSQVKLKKYDTEKYTTAGGEPVDSSKVVLFSSQTDYYGFRFMTAEQRFDTRDFNFNCTLRGDSAVYYYINPAPGAEFGILYTLQPDSYVLNMEIVQKGMDKVLPLNTTQIDFDFHQKMRRNELGKTFEERNSAIFYKFIGESVDEMDANGDDSQNLSGRLRWVAFKNQFFSGVVIARDCFNGAQLNSVDIKSDNYLKDLTMTAGVPYNVTVEKPASFDFYFGPNDYPLLSNLDEHLGYDEDLSLTRLIPLGWGLFRWINTLIIIPVFTFLGKFIASYGIIILLLTIFIKLIIFPFTYKSFMSQAKMRVLAPEIKEINEKYPDQEDALKRQQETMALYSRAGASPFSGCLPMLLQMPVLIAMFSFFPSAIELRGESFLWAHDLSAPDVIFTLPFSIPFYGNHVSLFCLLMTIINVVYMRVSMQSQPTSQGMPGMKMMMYVMPVMFLFIFNDYASGLSYYYLLSLLITIIQTYIFRKVVDEKKVREQLLANTRKPRKKSGWMARLEEAQRQAQAAQRQQQNSGKRRR